MAFKWSGKKEKGQYAEGSFLKDVKEKLSDLDARILQKNPISTADINFTFLEKEGEKGKVIKPVIIDEIQSNLDILKSENYCRGYYSSEKTTDYFSEFSTANITECVAHNSTLHSTFYGANYDTEHSTRHGTVYTNNNTVYHSGRVGA